MHTHTAIITVVLAFASNFLTLLSAEYDYCQANLCRPNLKHIGCGNTGNFGPNCPTERTLIRMTSRLKAYLLAKHNEARSNIAIGKISGYKTAERMVEMVRKKSSRVKLFLISKFTRVSNSPGTMNSLNWRNITLRLVLMAMMNVSAQQPINMLVRISQLSRQLQITLEL